MNPWARLSREVRVSLLQNALVLTVGVTALGAVFPIANYGVLHDPEPHEFTALAVLSLTLLALAFIFKRRGSLGIIKLLEAELQSLRIEVVTRLAGSPLRFVESNKAVQNKLVGDLEELDSAVSSASSSVYDAVLLTFLASYVLVVSPGGFLIWCAINFGLGAMLVPDFLESRRSFRSYIRARNQMYGELDRALQAFPQLQLDAAARRSVQIELKGRIDACARQRHETTIKTQETTARSSTFLYLGVATMLFSAPRQLGLDVEATYELVTLLFLTMVPASRLIRSTKTFLSAKLSFTEIGELLDRLAPAEPDGPPSEAPAFDRLAFKGVRFWYGPPEAPGFTVGPIDLEIKRGELVFLTGANGSGKTTFMKVIAGLYPPGSGGVYLDDRLQWPDDAEAYRALFTTIYTDQHLFPKLYGLEDSPRDEVSALLERFALGSVTGLNKKGRFTSLKLSSGQKKRLSMVVALLEDRPIYLLDEWAAHQDPQLRRYYYETLLPELKARGRTVIAVSHDDRFFHLADRVVHLVKGQMSDTPDAWLEGLDAPDEGPE